MWHKPPPENFEIDIQVSQYPRVTYQQHIKRNWEKYNKYKKKNNNKKPTWKRKGLKIALNLKSRKFQYPSTFYPLTLCSCGILVPQPEIEPGPLAMRAQSPNHRTTMEFSSPLLISGR